MRYVSVNSATDEWRELVPGGLGGELPKDADWLTFETVKLRINPALNAEQREALRMDYGLAGEILELRVRRSIRPYLWAAL